jgi:hypothetical protein
LRDGLRPAELVREGELERNDSPVGGQQRRVRNGDLDLGARRDGKDGSLEHLRAGEFQQGGIALAAHDRFVDHPRLRGVEQFRGDDAVADLHREVADLGLGGDRKKIRALDGVRIRITEDGMEDDVGDLVADLGLDVERPMGDREGPDASRQPVFVDDDLAGKGRGRERQDRQGRHQDPLHKVLRWNRSL